MTTDNLATVEPPTLSYSTIEEAIEALECLQMTFVANNVDCRDTANALIELRQLLRKADYCSTAITVTVKEANRSYLINKVSNFKFSNLTTHQAATLNRLLERFAIDNQYSTFGENKCKS